VQLQLSRPDYVILCAPHELEIVPTSGRRCQYWSSGFSIYPQRLSWIPLLPPRRISFLLGATDGKLCSESSEHVRRFQTFLLPLLWLLNSLEHDESLVLGIRKQNRGKLTPLMISPSKFHVRLICGWTFAVFVFHTPNFLPYFRHGSLWIPFHQIS